MTRPLCADALPLIEIAIEPKSKADREKFGAALAKLTAGDLSFRVSTDLESGQTIIRGMDELHLETKVDILRRIYEVEANIGAPGVAYRETITCAATIDYTYKKPAGPKGISPASRLRSSRCRQGRACSIARQQAAQSRRNTSPVS
jgi:translation elongation factor EF-G